eukprot:4899097-Pleurochrysis_carterae.AAC.1
MWVPASPPDDVSSLKVDDSRRRSRNMQTTLEACSICIGFGTAVPSAQTQGSSCCVEGVSPMPSSLPPLPPIPLSPALSSAYALSPSSTNDTVTSETEEKEVESSKKMTNDVIRGLGFAIGCLAVIAVLCYFCYIKPICCLRRHLRGWRHSTQDPSLPSAKKPIPEAKLPPSEQSAEYKKNYADKQFVVSKTSSSLKQSRSQHKPSPCLSLPIGDQEVLSPALLRRPMHLYAKVRVFVGHGKRTPCSIPTCVCQLVIAKRRVVQGACVYAEGIAVARRTNALTRTHKPSSAHARTHMARSGMARFVHTQNFDDEAAQESLFDVWTNSVFASVNSGDPDIMRIVREGGIPFPCEAYGWFGVFACRHAHDHSMVKHMEEVPVLDLVFERSFATWRDLASVGHFMLRFPMGVAGCEYRESSD